MSRNGTTKSSVKTRRARNDKTARLIAFVRRFGVIFGLVIVSLWLGTMIWLGGFVQRGAEWAQQQTYEMAAGAGFAVRDVLVEGRVNTDPDVLRALVNIEPGDPIFALDPKEAKDLIERISWVKEAHVERRLPDVVYIGLLERQPMALWQHKKKVRLIDAEGVTLADHDIERFKDMVIIVGEHAPGKAPKLMEMLEAEPLLKNRISAASWVSDRRWDLQTRSGMTIKLPEYNLGLVLRKLAAAQEEDNLLDKDLVSIDLREADRMIVKTRPGAVREYKASTGSPI